MTTGQVTTSRWRCAARVRALLKKYYALENNDAWLATQYEKIAKSANTNDKRTIRRYLEKYARERNQYCSDVVWEIKNIIESALSSKFFEKVDVWKSSAAWEIWEGILDIQPEWKYAQTAEVMDQVEEWIKNHLIIYFATSKEIVKEDLNPAAMHYILKLIEIITRAMWEKNPLLSDKGFKMFLDFEPRPFDLQCLEDSPTEISY